MNILQLQNTLKDLSDGQLQQQLLNPDGSAPGFLVLTELQRRKNMRDNFNQQKLSGKSMAEEYASGIGAADVGKFTPAMRGAMPGGEPIMNPAVQPQGNISAPQEGEPQAFAGGGQVNIHGLDLTPFMQQQNAGGMGAMNFQSGMSIPPLAPRNRRYLGPGVPSATGIENVYFAFDPPAPAASGVASGGLGIAPAIMAAQAFVDGSANGATGNDSGSVGSAGDGTAGGVSGTGGVGGSASSDSGVGGSAAAGVGGDDGGTYSDGGRVGMGLIKGALKYADGGEVGSDDWMWPSVARYRRLMGITGTGIPSEPSSRPRLPRVPNWALPVQEIPPEAEPPMSPLPRRGLGVAERFYPPQPADYPPAFPTDPGKSTGQTIADVISGRSVLGIPRNVGETGGTPEMPQMVFVPPGEAGETGGEPVISSGGQGYGGPEPMGVINEVPESTGISDPSIPGRQGMVAPGVAPAAGGGGGTSGGGLGGALNIGGEGLESYVNQIRGLQRADGFGDIEKGILADRAELEKSRESDKGLALLTAGLGIMGGTSPFAAVNIGQGAMAGVEQYNRATKEQRAALRDLRNAENQITIARANRDERQLEKGISLYARAQENLQRSMDRQSREGISSADRAANRALKEKELEAITTDRRERAEQSRISDLGTRANQYGREADALDMKIATLQANPLATTGDAAGEIARLKAQSDALRQQAHQYGQMYNRAIVEREVKSGRLAAPKTEEEYKKLKPGTRYLHIDGQLKVKP